MQPGNAFLFDNDVIADMQCVVAPSNNGKQC